MLLIDSDAFCTFGISGLIGEVAALVGTDRCARLAALPYMLRKGRLRRKLGDEHCRILLRAAERLPDAPSASAEWLDKLRAITDVDPGEAQLDRPRGGA